MTTASASIWVTMAILVGVVAVAIILAVLVDARLNDLEDRVVIFETIRIEYVAPTQDGG